MSLETIALILRFAVKLGFLGRFLATTWLNRLWQLPHGVFVYVIVEILEEVYDAFVPLELISAVNKNKIRNRYTREKKKTFITISWNVSCFLECWTVANVWQNWFCHRVGNQSCRCGRKWGLEGRGH